MAKNLHMQIIIGEQSEVYLHLALHTGLGNRPEVVKVQLDRSEVRYWAGKVRYIRSEVPPYQDLLPGSCSLLMALGLIDEFLKQNRTATLGSTTVIRPGAVEPLPNYQFGIIDLLYNEAGIPRPPQLCF